VAHITCEILTQEVHVFPVDTMMTYGGSKLTAPLICSLGNTWEWVNITLLRRFNPGKWIYYPLNRRLDGLPVWKFWRKKKSLAPTRILTVQPVAESLLPTEPLRLDFNTVTPEYKFSQNSPALKWKAFTLTVL